MYYPKRINPKPLKLRRKIKTTLKYNKTKKAIYTILMYKVKSAVLIF